MIVICQKNAIKLKKAITLLVLILEEREKEIGKARAVAMAAVMSANPGRV